MKKLKNNRGLTLLEVIISIAILGIVATAFLNLFGNSFVSMASFGEKSEAVMVAADIIEQVYSNADKYEKEELGSLLSDTGIGEDALKGEKKSDENSLDDSLPEGKSFNYYLDSEPVSISGDSLGFNLTIAYPKGNSGEMERLTTFIIEEKP